MTEPAESWRDHVEQMLRTWRCSHLNEDGDRLALDDFLDQDSIEDLIDFVCDEWSAPAPVALTDEEIAAIAEGIDCEDWMRGHKHFRQQFARALLARTGEAK